MAIKSMMAKNARSALSTVPLMPPTPPLVGSETFRQCPRTKVPSLRRCEDTQS